MTLRLGPFYWFLAVCLVWAAAPLRAQEACVPKSLQLYKDEALAAALEVPSREAARETASEEQFNRIRDGVEAQPSAPAAPQGFASRVNDSLADFLPLFQFAVSSVSTSDDEEAVTVKFNPLKLGRNGTISVTATVSEPQPFESLVEAIPEASRSDQEDVIGEHLGDFDDVTWSLTYGFQRSDEALRKPQNGSKGEVSWDRKFLWGRNPLLYAELFNVLMEDLWETAIPARPDLQSEFAELEVEIACAFDGDCCEVPPTNGGSPMDGRCTFSLRQATDCDLLQLNNGELLLTRYKAIATRWVEEVELPISRALSDARLSELVALVDNQPQATATVSYRDADEHVGQKTLAVEVAVELGTRNLNTLLRRYRELKDNATDTTPLDAWNDFRKDESYQNKNRFTFSAAYLRRSDYSFTYQFETSATPQNDGTTVVTLENVPLMLEEAEELSASFLYSRSMGWPVIRVAQETVTPRLDLSAELVDVDDDPMRQDRLIARLGYVLPLGSGMSLPITLTWANHSEFLGEQDRELSAHFGLSYSLDRGRQ